MFHPACREDRKHRFYQISHAKINGSGYEWYLQPDTEGPATAAYSLRPSPMLQLEHLWLRSPTGCSRFFKFTDMSLGNSAKAGSRGIRLVKERCDCVTNRGNRSVASKGERSRCQASDFESIADDNNNQDGRA